MKITKDIDYAIRLTLFLAISKNFSATKKEIAKEMQIPPLFLSKIAQILSKKKILEISQGPKGRYKLKKLPHNITLLEIIETIKGEISLSYCIEGEDKCFRQDRCGINKIWKDATSLVRNYFDKINFQDLAEQEICFLKGIAK